MLERGFELSANLPEFSSCLLVLQGYEQGTGEYFCLRERTQTHNTQLFLTTFRAPYAVLRDGGEEFWCFLLADLSVGVQTAARAPLCPLFCRNPRAISGKESLADGRGRARRRPGQPDGTNTKCKLTIQKLPNNTHKQSNRFLKSSKQIWKHQSTLINRSMLKKKIVEDFKLGFLRHKILYH